MKAKKIDAGRAKLEKELRDAMKEVDEEGLLFLLRQAQVLIYNVRVDRINAAGKQITGRKQQESAAPVSIEETKGGKQIFLTIGRERKILAPEEMKRIVRICYSAESKSEALRQLFTVLAKERKYFPSMSGCAMTRVR
jgi:hypothetical protein